MCWQDVRISNAQTVASTNFSQGPSSQLAYGPNKRRRRLIISTDGLPSGVGGSYNVVGVWMGNSNVPQNQLLFYGSSSVPIVLDAETFGVAIQGSLYVVPDVTGNGHNWCVVEIELNDPYDLGSPRGQPE